MGQPAADARGCQRTPADAPGRPRTPADASGHQRIRPRYIVGSAQYKRAVPWVHARYPLSYYVLVVKLEYLLRCEPCTGRPRGLDAECNVAPALDQHIEDFRVPLPSYRAMWMWELVRTCGHTHTDRNRAMKWYTHKLKFT